MIGVDVIITNNLHNSSAKLFKSWNDIFYGNMQCEAVIMGSSRGQMQFNPAILDSILGINSYNISVDGRAIDAEVIKYNTYRCYNPKPKLIIQNIDCITLRYSNGYEREQFLPYFWCDTLFSMVRKSESFTFAERYMPLVRYSGYYQVIMEGLHMPNKLNKESLYKGFCGRDNNWDGRLFSEQTNVVFCQDSDAVLILDKFLRQCRQEGIQVILVFAPIYIGVTEKMENPQYMFDFFQQIADKYDYPILNYTYDSLSYDTTYFYNSTHLNRRGAELFSSKLAHDIEKLGLWPQ